MNIQNIQITHGFFRAAEEKIDSGRGAVSAESDPILTHQNSSRAQEQALPAPSVGPGKRVDGLETRFPPFFPLGNTQGIYSLMIESRSDGSSPDSSEARQADGIRKDEGAERDAVFEGKQNGSPKDVSIKGQTPAEEEAVYPGGVLDVKI